MDGQEAILSPNDGKNKKSKISRSFNRFKANPIRNFDGNTYSNL
jgi:hypothetical protein